MATGQTEGRRRLTLLLGFFAVAACAAAIFLVVIFYGRPYNPLWWAVMAAILVGVFFVSRLAAPLVEWVIDGYRLDRDRS